MFDARTRSRPADHLHQRCGCGGAQQSATELDRAFVGNQGQKQRKPDASSLVDTDCAVAVGGSLTAVTVIDTVAADDVAVPSDTVNVNLSEPL